MATAPPPLPQGYADAPPLPAGFSEVQPQQPSRLAGALTPDQQSRLDAWARKHGGHGVFQQTPEEQAQIENFGKSGATTAGTLGRLAATPVTGVAGIPGALADYVQRGLHVPPSGGYAMEEPVTQSIGAATMAALPVARDAAPQAGSFVGGALKAGARALPDARTTIPAAMGYHFGGPEWGAAGAALNVLPAMYRGGMEAIRGQAPPAPNPAPVMRPAPPSVPPGVSFSGEMPRSIGPSGPPTSIPAGTYFPGQRPPSTGPARSPAPIPTGTAFSGEPLPPQGPNPAGLVQPIPAGTRFSGQPAPAPAPRGPNPVPDNLRQSFLMGQHIINTLRSAGEPIGETPVPRPASPATAGAAPTPATGAGGAASASAAPAGQAVTPGSLVMEGVPERYGNVPNPKAAWAKDQKIAAYIRQTVPGITPEQFDAELPRRSGDWAKGADPSYRPINMKDPTRIGHLKQLIFGGQ